MNLSIGFDAPRILDFDIEARPLGWYGGDFVHKEVTAIASAWIVDDEPQDLEVLLLTRRKGSQAKMLRTFLKRYVQAGIVTGHYIRGFDLPVLNGAMLESGFRSFDPKPTQDTKGDLLRFAGVSKSQENLGSLLGVSAPKIVMSQGDWREANRLTSRGLELVAERVTADVVQHVALRKALRDAGFLSPPKVWDPGAPGSSPGYQP